MNSNMAVGDNYVNPRTYNYRGENLTDNTVMDTPASFTEILAEEIGNPAASAPSGTEATIFTQQQPQVHVNETLQKTETTKDLLMAMFLGGGSGGVGNIITSMLMSQIISNMSQSQNNTTSAYTECAHNHTQSYNANGSSVVNLAMSRMGDPYSQAMAGQGSYLDCSYLAMWSYRNVGVNLPRTAAEQAEYCVNNGVTVSEAELQPGDLVFFSHNSNGRFMNVTHVAVYAGDGMIVDASSSRGQVVYRPMLSGAVLYGRPGSSSYGTGQMSVPGNTISI